MAAKISFDNNVIDKLLLPGNQPRIAPILHCVERGALEFYGTNELVGEALRIIESPARAGNLQHFGAVIGALTDGRHFKTPEGIMQGELTGGADPVAPAEERRLLRGLLGAIATAKPNMANVKAIANEMKRYMDTTAKGWRDRQDKFRAQYAKLSKVDRSIVRNTTYETFQTKNWEAKGRDSIRYFCRDYNILDPDAVADRVMANPAAFPWTLRWQRIFALLLYWQLGQDRVVADGDQNDAKQLYILTAVDFFVTGDAVFSEWAAILGDAVDKILTVDHFLDRSWC